MKVLSGSSVDTEKTYNSNKISNFFTFHNEIFLIAIYLIVILALKFVLSLFLWRNGFIEYDADGFTRSVSAWKARSNLFKLEIDAWLPLQFWLNGGLLNFWPDLLRLPRLVNIICSAFTTINLFLVGRFLFGRINGYLTGFLAALFPWEIWFGISGMSESLTHFFLTFGLVFFCIWLNSTPGRNWWLLLASFGFLGATMVRYEAWFYSAVYALLALYLTWRTHPTARFTNLLKVCAVLAPAFIFIVIWMAASWLDPTLHSPLGFAKKTSEINANIYGEANINATFFDRLFYYPQTFFNLLWSLTIPAILSSIWLAIYPVKAIRFYLGLIWGEFVLFILTTLPYNNIAPGSARYPVSNLLLLLPIVAYPLQLLFQKSAIHYRLAAGLLTAILILSTVQTTITHHPVFPDGETRHVAEWLNSQWQDGSLRPGEKVVIQLPFADGPRANDFTRAYYALKALTNHPDSFEVFSDFAEFQNRVMVTDSTAPSVWVQMKSAGGNTTGFNAHYREIKDFGDYIGGRFSAFRPALVSPENGAVDQSFTFSADQFGPKETTISWLTGPDKKVITLGNKDADPTGKLSFLYQIKEPKSGTWAITIVGMQTGRRAIAQFELRS